METLDGRLFSFGASVECITNSVQEGVCSDESITKNINTVNEVLNSSWMTSLSKLNNELNNKDRIKVSLFCRQLEEIVVGLWNASVVRSNSKKFEEKTGVLLRQLCYNLIASSIFQIIKQGSKAEPANSYYYHRKIMMGIKTAKGWMDIKDFNKARDILQQALSDVESLLEAVYKSGNIQPGDSEVSGLIKNQATLLCYSLETMFRLGDYEEMKVVLEYLSNLKQASSSTGSNATEENHQSKIKDRERECIICITYNLGLEAANSKVFEQAEVLLKFSFEFKKENAENSSQTAQTLRLLAHVYWEKEGQDHITKALETAKLSNQYYKHPAGYHLILRIMCEVKEAGDEEVKAVLSDLLSHPDLDINHGLSACRHLNARKKYEVCEFGLTKLLSRFQGCRQIGRVHVQRLQTSIDRLPPNDRTNFVEEFLSDPDVISSIDGDVENQLHLLLWEQAAKSHEEDDLENCLAWYDRSLALYLRDKSLSEVKENDEMRDNVAKLYRNKSSCYIELARLKQAEEASKLALGLDENNLFSNFTRLKVSIAQERQAEAVQTIDVMINKCDNLPIYDEDELPTITATGNLGSKHGLICLAAQLAFERNQTDVAMAALRHLANAQVHEVAQLTAHRCLVRLYLTMSEELTDNKKRKLDAETSTTNGNRKKELLEKVIDGVTEALQVLKNMKKKEIDAAEWQPPSGEDFIILPETEPKKFDGGKFRDEVMWFMKVAWNVALDIDDDYSTMKLLFHMCKDLLNLLDKDEAVLLRMKTCLLMCAASGLALARKNSNMMDSSKVREHFRNVVEDVNECRVVCQQLKEIRDEIHDKSSVLLELYQLEATAKLLGSYPQQDAIASELNEIFQRLVALPAADVKTFETISALAMERPARHPALSQAALKLVIYKLNKQISETNDHDVKCNLVKKRSSSYRLLIELTMKNSSCLDPTSQSDSWIFCNEVYCFLQQDAIKHPEADTLWLSVKSWNIGVRFYVSNHLVDAEKWCSLAIRLLTYAERYRDGYEKHMSTTYQDILAKKDSIVC